MHRKDEIREMIELSREDLRDLIQALSSRMREREYDGGTVERLARIHKILVQQQDGDRIVVLANKHEIDEEYQEY